MGSLITCLNSRLWDNHALTDRLSQCDVISQSKLLLIRIIAFIIILQMDVWMLILYTSRTLLYMTHWTAYLVLVTYGVLIMRDLTSKPNCWSRWWKLTHLCFELSFSFGVVVTVLFWTVIAPLLFSMSPAELEQFNKRPAMWADYVVNLEIHGINYLFVFIDMYFNRIEFEWSHLIFHFPAALLYYSVLCIYTLVSNDQVYPNVTFRNGFTVLFSVGGFAAAFLAFVCGFWLSRRKKSRYANCSGKLPALPLSPSSNDQLKAVLDSS